MPKDPPSNSVDWERDEDIIVPKQMPIRAFLNSHGNIALVQESEDSHEHDQLVVIRPENARAVIAAITRLLDEAPRSAT